MSNLTVQFQKQKNQMLNEDIVVPRLVNTQTIDFLDWCQRMANGSTVTSADVAAVMQQIENKLPELLVMNAKVVCSPSGLTFRPKVSGSISQSELKAKLVARKAAETDPQKAAKIDVDRALTTSDLSVSDCTVSIVVDLPKSWSVSFNQSATLKRVAKATVEVAESGSGAADGSGSTESGNSGTGDDTGSTDSGNQGSTDDTTPYTPPTDPNDGGDGD